MLDELDDRLAGRRFLFGAEPVETDWRLFTTLVRFDAVYQIHFKCSLRKLIEYEHLWPYARDLYQWPGVAETVAFDEIRRHYYLTHPMINPSGLVAVRAGGRLRRAARPRVARLARPRVSRPGASRLNSTRHASRPGRDDLAARVAVSAAGAGAGPAATSRPRRRPPPGPDCA